MSRIEYGNEIAQKKGYNVTLYYSTPNCYLKAVKKFDPTLPTKQDDFFPYASDPTAYWTGYFTSRPTTKYFERLANNYLQVVKQLQVFAGIPSKRVDELKSAVGIMQHHDAVTGTEKQHVAHDYERLLNDAVEGAMDVVRDAINKITTDKAGSTVLQCQRCSLNESSCHVSENKRKFIVTVYNPLGWEIAATPVRLPVNEGVYEIFDPEGKNVETQILEIPERVLNIPTRNSQATHEVLFIAENLPPLGFKSFYVKKQIKKIQKRHTQKSIGNDKDLRFREIYKFNSYFDDIKKSDYTGLINTVGINLNAVQKTKINTEQLMAEVDIIDQDENSQTMDFLLTEKPVENNNVNRFIEPNINLDILKDNQYDSKNKDIEYFKKLALEARKNQFGSSTKDALDKDSGNKRVRYPSLNDEEMHMLADEPVIEKHPDDIFLENQHIRLRINNTTGQITHIKLTSGMETPFSLETYYYPGCVGNNVNPANRSSGAYIFRPNATEPYELIQNDSKLSRGNIVEESQYTSSSYVSGVTRVYKNKKIDYVEHEWLIGPIPIKDDIGKEVIVRYVTDVVNNGEFYTDSNGRQMLKRILNKRPQWNLTLEEPIAGNYYPITNEIYIEDGKTRVTVLTDRSQGGSSLIEGNIEVMLHRRLLHDDAFGVGEALNETAEGMGLVVRGQHRLFVTDQTDKERITDIKKDVLEFHSHPLLFFSDAEQIELDQWLHWRNTYGSFHTSLPKGLHLLTLEYWNESQLLVRLENYLEKSDNNDTTIEVNMSNIFKNIKIKSYEEFTLGANLKMKDYIPWKWNKESEFDDNFNKKYGNFDTVPKTVNRQTKHSVSKVYVAAKEIRTLILDYELVPN